VIHKLNRAKWSPGDGAPHRIAAANAVLKQAIAH